MIETKFQKLVEIDLGRSTDDELRTARKDMIAARLKIQVEWDAFGDKKFSDPQANALYQDIQYYNNCVSRVESEMSYRLITL